jgi:outer membrane protein assembly factor BamB
MDPGDMILGDGATFVDRDARLLALSPSGEVLWHLEEARVVALAGKRRELLLAYDLHDDDWLAVDPATGRERWRADASELRGEPRIDREGRIYVRRGESLARLDGETGELAEQVEIGGGWNDFAFVGEGKLALLRRVGVTRTELVVVGE